MTETKTTQMYRVYIKATPQAIWDAITTPEWTERYGYGGRSVYELRPGGSYKGYTTEEMRAGGTAMGVDVPEIGVDGEVIEVDPPRRLVQTFRMLMDPGLAAEGFTRLTYEIEENVGGTSRLTVIHELENAPRTAELMAGGLEEQGAGGGWAWILSTLKTLLETGEAIERQ
ncbi:MAG TPA: SRPBCC family protein [Actinomycetota bacterium]|nr:SRPBCC family protein [Actinomycetota bacterium]